MTTDDSYANLHHTFTLYDSRRKIFLTSKDEFRKQGVVWIPEVVFLQGKTNVYTFYLLYTVGIPVAGAPDAGLTSFRNEATGCRLEVWETEAQMRERWKVLRGSHSV